MRVLHCALFDPLAGFCITISTFRSQSSFSFIKTKQGNLWSINDVKQMTLYSRCELSINTMRCKTRSTQNWRFIAPPTWRSLCRRLVQTRMRFDSAHYSMSPISSFSIPFAAVEKESRRVWTWEWGRMTFSEKPSVDDNPNSIFSLLVYFHRSTICICLLQLDKLDKVR